jgi:hypothetical protein
MPCDTADWTAGELVEGGYGSDDQCDFGENIETEGCCMLYTLAVILIVIWVLGLVSDLTGGGVIHLLLLAAAIMVVAQLIQGRKSQRRKNLKLK